MTEGDRTLGKARVARLREWLAANDLDGFLVPRADEHQGEYVADRSERLKWLTGFSAARPASRSCSPDRALIFVDGRYTLQVRDQVDLDVFSIESLVDNPPADWIKDNSARARGSASIPGCTRSAT